MPKVTCQSNHWNQAGNSRFPTVVLSWGVPGAAKLSVPLLGVCLMACSPVARLQIRFVLSGSAALDPTRFHVTGSKTCPPGPVGAPAPAALPGDMEHAAIEADGARAVETTATFRGSSCNVRVAGWLDSDGSGSVNRGDFVAVSPPIVIRDRGILRGNLTRGPTLTLSAVP